MPEKRVRDLNDEINKLLREKNRWERRILDLGGPNYFVCSYLCYYYKFAHFSKYYFLNFCQAQSNRVLEEAGGGKSVGGGKGEYK